MRWVERLWQDVPMERQGGAGVRGQGGQTRACPASGRRLREVVESERKGCRGCVVGGDGLVGRYPVAVIERMSTQLRVSSAQKDGQTDRETATQCARRDGDTARTARRDGRGRRAQWEDLRRNSATSSSPCSTSGHALLRVRRIRVAPRDLTWSVHGAVPSMRMPASNRSRTTLPPRPRPRPPLLF